MLIVSCVSVAVAFIPRACPITLTTYQQHPRYRGNVRLCDVNLLRQHRDADQEQMHVTRFRYSSE